MRVIIQPTEPEELSLIYSSWKQSTLWSSSGSAKRSCLWPRVTQAQHYILATVVLDDWLKRAAVCLTARAEAAPTLALGWVMAGIELDTPTVYYCWVKPQYRRQGVAKALVREALVQMGGYHPPRGGPVAAQWQFSTPLRKPMTMHQHGGRYVGLVPGKVSG